MIRVRLSGATQLVQSLGAELVQLGAELGVSDSQLILIGASTLAAAASHLDALPEADRRRAIIVGLDEYLDYELRPRPGTYGAFLEHYGVLGSMPLELATTWENFGFVGRMTLANELKLWYGGPSHSANYAIWAGLERFTSAAAFLVRLLELLELPEQEGRAEATDEPT